MKRVVLLTSAIVMLAGVGLVSAQEPVPAPKIAPAAVAVAAGKEQTLCPVMEGKKINKNLFVDVDGKRVYVCCKYCQGVVKKDAAKYIKQIEDSGVTLEKAPAPEAKTLANTDANDAKCDKCGKAVAGSADCCK